MAALLVIMALGVGAALIFRSSTTAAGNPDEAARPSLDHALASSTGPQTGALSDGSVTCEEYDAAVAATAACLEDARVEAVVYPGEGAQVSRVGFKVAALDDGPAAEEALAGCKQTHLSAIDEAWQAQSWPSDDAIADSRAWMVRCMVGQGIATNGSDPDTQLKTWAASPDQTIHVAWAICRRDFVPLFGHSP